MKVRVNGQLTFNTSDHVVDAASGRVRHRLLPEEELAHIREGRLVRVLESFGVILFRATIFIILAAKRLPQPSLVVDALRMNGKL